MSAIRARVIDATHLELSSPLDLPLGHKVVISVTEVPEDDERPQWLAASADSLRSAYGDSEPEYSLALLKERNPGFGR
jgi:hypothetical protein